MTDWWSGSIPVRDRQLLGREQRDHAAALVGDHDLFLDARRRIAVLGGAVGFEREHHAFLDLGRMGERDDAADDWPLVQRQPEAMAELQTEGRHLVRKAELLRLWPHAADLVGADARLDQ